MNMKKGPSIDNRELKGRCFDQLADLFSKSIAWSRGEIKDKDFCMIINRSVLTLRLLLDGFDEE